MTNCFQTRIGHRCVKLANAVSSNADLDDGATETGANYVSAANTVTVSVCTNLAAGGTPSAYNVRVIE